MKISILTQHSVCNYGTQLQLFATQKKFLEYFEEVEFIDYRRPDTYGIGLIKTYTKGNIFKIPIILPTFIYWKYRFGGFIKKYINLSSKKYKKLTDFVDFVEDSDAYIVGSDQVWNSGWNNGIIPIYYLSFVSKNSLKYSYASSFGRNTISDDESIKIKQYLDEFNEITVREASAVKIINEQVNYQKVKLLLDPTLAFSGMFWRKYASCRKINEKYILIYNLKRNKNFDKFASRISKITGIKLYRLCTRFDQIIKNGKSIIIPPIFDFVSLIDNAEMVITDSFHATAFSLNLNTEPICVLPDKYTNRISEFLEYVGCSQRIVKDYNDIEVINRHVDFNYVNEILKKERRKYNIYLQDIVEQINEKENLK